MHQNILPTRMLPGVRLNSSLNDAKEKPATTRIFGRDITNMAGNKENNPKNKEPFKQPDLFAGGAKIVERNRILSEAPTVKKTATPPASPKTADMPIERLYEAEILQTLFRDNKPLESSDLITVTPKMRTILVDWLVDVHASFELKDRTFHMALRLLDEYSTVRGSTKAQFQLVGITCLWIASKYEEIHPPRMKHFVEITANTYSAAEMFDMEMTILKTLNFNLVKTTAWDLLPFFELGQSNLHFCQYACELAALEGLTLQFSPSQILESAVRLADNLYKTKTTVPGPFMESNTKESVYKCFTEFCRLLSSEQKYNLKAIKRKYSKAEFSSVGLLVLEHKNRVM